MRRAIVALVCTLGAVACGGEQRPAENPSQAPTSYSNETTTTSAFGSPSTPAPSTPSTSATTPQTPPNTTPSTIPMTESQHDVTLPDTPGIAPSTTSPEPTEHAKDAAGTKKDDRRGAAKPATDQGAGKDRDITAAVRRAVVSDSSLSFAGKTIKIVTVGGKVTLRGTVKNDAEKSAIESKVKGTAGVADVDNQLEVKK